MPSTNKTANLNLSQFVSTDKPNMQDYNADMQNLSNAVGVKIPAVEVPKLITTINTWTNYGGYPLTCCKCGKCATLNGLVINQYSSSGVIGILPTEYRSGGLIVTAYFGGDGKIYYGHINLSTGEICLTNSVPANISLCIQVPFNLN